MYLLSFLEWNFFLNIVSLQIYFPKSLTLLILIYYTFSSILVRLNPRFNMKEYYGKKSWVNNVRVKSQKQFYALDTKVLRMFLQDKNSGREYIMFYFLADDSIELKIHNEKNRCQDLHLTYLKRRKVPVEFQVELPGLQQESKFVCGFCLCTFRGDF